MKTKKKLKLPPIPGIRNVEMNREERHLVEGLLSQYRMDIVNARERKALTPEDAKKHFDMINRLSDKVMPEEEAAAELQALGFEIVEKEHD